MSRPGTAGRKPPPASARVTSDPFRQARVDEAELLEVALVRDRLDDHVELPATGKPEPLGVRLGNPVHEHLRRLPCQFAPL